MTKATRVPKENKWGAKSRFYQVGEKQYPSVTTILSVIGKPALVAWSAKVEREMVIDVSADLYLDCPSSPRMSRIGWITSLSSRLTKEKAHSKELKKAGEIGNETHSLIEWSLRASLMEKVGAPPKVSEKAMWAFSAWERWKESVNLKPIMVEFPVWSTTYGYAGTADLLAQIDGKITLLDWKTGKSIYRESYLQNAAYRHAVEEMRIAVVEQGIIVRLPKVETDPEFEFQVVPEHPTELMAAFLSFLDGWKWLNKDVELTDSPEAAPEEGTKQPTESKEGAAAVAPIL